MNISETYPRLALFVLLLPLMIAVADCQSQSTRLTKILHDLHSNSIEVRDTAYQRLIELSNVKLTHEESVQVMEATGEHYSPLSDSKSEITAGLFFVAEKSSVPEYILIVRRLFARYPMKEKIEAINMLGTIDDKKSVEGTAELILEFENRICAGAAKESVQQRTEHVLVDIAMYEVLLNDVKKQWIGKELMQRLSPAILCATRSYGNLLGPMQSSLGTDDINWEEYAILHYNMAYLLDILGYIPGDEEEKELRNAMDLSDPYLKLFDICSLLRRGITAPPAEFLRVAQSGETRNLLYDNLTELKRIDLFPRKYLTQEALADGAMESWLTYPTELGQLPDSIELMTIRNKTTKQGIEDYYFYKFKTNPPHKLAERGWLAGVAGPFLRANTPTITAGGETFSEFNPWTDSFPDDYMKPDPDDKP
ncbi:MAG: hypothetical protein ABI876_10250 [Bacteroidota bacterium]